MQAGVLDHLAWIDEHQGLARFLFADRPPEVDAAASRLAELNRHFFAALRVWIRPHVNAGVLADLPTQLLVALWVGPAQLLGRLHVTGQLHIPLPEAAGPARRRGLDVAPGTRSRAAGRGRRRG